jgi:hypothetical protein
MTLAPTAVREQTVKARRFLVVLTDRIGSKCGDSVSCEVVAASTRRVCAGIRRTEERDRTTAPNLAGTPLPKSAERHVVAVLATASGGLGTNGASVTPSASSM